MDPQMVNDQVKTVFRNHASSKVPEFESSLDSVTNSGNGCEENTHLDYQMNLPRKFILQQVLSFPKLRDFFQEFAEQALMKSHSYTFHDVSRFGWDLTGQRGGVGPWNPHDVATEGADTSFEQRITTFYRDHISLLASSLASLVSNQAQTPDNFRFEGITQAGSTQSAQRSAQAILVHRQQAETGGEPQHTLCVWSFHESTELNDGVWTALDEIAGRKAFPWHDPSGEPSPHLTFQDNVPNSHDIQLDVLDDPESGDFASWGLTKPDVLDHTSGPGDNRYTSSNVPERDYHNARMILQKGWSLAVKYNTSFLVISNGNCERIGIRHRTWGTLFLSGIVNVSRDPDYWTYLVGHYLASYRETINRHERQTAAQTSFRDLFQSRTQLIRHPRSGPGRLPGIEDYISTADSIQIHIDRTVFTWDRHEHDTEDRPRSCRIRERKKLQTISKGPSGSEPPYKTTTYLGGGSFHFQTIRVPSFFSYEGYLNVKKQRQKSNLVALTAQGPHQCQILCTYYQNYTRLVKIRGLHIPQHYGLFQWGGCSSEWGRLILIAENPGSYPEEGMELVESQKKAFRDQLDLIHRAGFLHGNIVRENCHIGIDGATVCILGFANMTPLNPQFDIAQKGKKDEVAALDKILGGSEGGSDEGEPMNVPTTHRQETQSEVLFFATTCIFSKWTQQGYKNARVKDTYESYDLHPSFRDKIFSFGFPPLTQPPKFQKDKRLIGPSPFTFYDRHVNENQRLQRVASLPTLSDDLIQKVDDRLAELETTGDGLLPVRCETLGEIQSLAVDQPSPDREITVDVMVKRLTPSIPSSCLPFVSHWVLHPRAARYDLALSFPHYKFRYIPGRTDDPREDFTFRFLPPENVRADTVSSIDHLAKEAMREWHDRDLMTWIILPLAPDSEQLLRNLDQLFALSVLPSPAPTMGGLSPVVDDSPPPCDAEITPWALPVLDPVEASDDLGIKKRSSSNPKDTHGPISISSFLRDNSRSQFEEMKEPTPEGFVHHAWRFAVQRDTTIIVLNCGNYERIAIRHRGSRTLYLSDVIDVTKPGYGKLHLGMLMSAVDDALDRYRVFGRKHRGPSAAARRAVKRPHKATSTENTEVRRSKRQRVNALLSKARDRHSLNKRDVQTLWQEVHQRPMLLLRFDGGGLKSSKPACCLRVGTPLSTSTLTLDVPPLEFRGSYEANEYSCLTLEWELSNGLTGHIFPGQLQVTLPNGRKISRGVVAKVADFAAARRRLWHEYRVYQHLWSQNTKRIPEIYGMFEDTDGFVTILLMERAVCTFRQREPITDENNGGLKEVPPSDR